MALISDVIRPANIPGMNMAGSFYATSDFGMGGLGDLAELAALEGQIASLESLSAKLTAAEKAAEKARKAAEAEAKKQQRIAQQLANKNAAAAAAAAKKAAAAKAQAEREAAKQVAAAQKKMVVEQKKAATITKREEKKAATVAKQAERKATTAAKTAERKATAAAKKDVRQEAAAKKKAEREAKRAAKKKKDTAVVAKISPALNAQLAKLKSLKDALVKCRGMTGTAKSACAAKVKATLATSDVLDAPQTTALKGLGYFVPRMSLSQRPMVPMVFPSVQIGAGLRPTIQRVAISRPRLRGFGEDITVTSDIATQIAESNAGITPLGLESQDPALTPMSNLPAMPKACTKRPDKPICLFYNLAANSQQMLYVIVQQIMSLQSEILALLNEMRTDVTTGATGGTDQAIVGYDDYGNPIYGQPTAQQPYYGGGVPNLDYSQTGMMPYDAGSGTMSPMMDQSMMAQGVAPSIADQIPAGFDVGGGGADVFGGDSGEAFIPTDIGVNTGPMYAAQAGPVYAPQEAAAYQPTAAAFAMPGIMDSSQLPAGFDAGGEDLFGGGGGDMESVAAAAQQAQMMPLGPSPDFVMPGYIPEDVNIPQEGEELAMDEGMEPEVEALPYGVRRKQQALPSGDPSQEEILADSIEGGAEEEN